MRPAHDEGFNGAAEKRMRAPQFPVNEQKAFSAGFAAGRLAALREVRKSVLEAREIGKLWGLSDINALIRREEGR